MPDIKRYDYQRNPHPSYHSAMSYFVHEHKTSLSLHPKAPWGDGNMFCCYYDKDDKLVGVRFVHKDGKYVDLIKAEDA